MHTSIYGHLDQLKICDIKMLTTLNNGQAFSIQVDLSDGQKLVCRVTIDPSLRDHRTGKWITYSALSLYEGVSFVHTLRDKVRNNVARVADEIIDTFFGD